jgi:thioredoxin 1
MRLARGAARFALGLSKRLCPPAAPVLALSQGGRSLMIIARYRDPDETESKRTYVMAKEIRSSEWQAEVVESGVPVLVDVFGTHCPPCRALAPTLDKLASEYDGRARVVKLDVEADRDLAGGLHVTSVPTVIAFREGEEMGRLVGLRPEAAYRKLLADAGVS